MTDGAGMGCARVRRGRRGDHGAAADDPGARRFAKGADRGDAEPAEAVLVGGAVLPVPVNGHILEVRDEAILRG